MFVSSQNPYIEALTSGMEVLGDGNFGKQLGFEGGAPVMGLMSFKEKMLTLSSHMNWGKAIQRHNKV